MPRWESRADCASRLALVVADADGHALGIPDLAADQKDGPGVLGGGDAIAPLACGDSGSIVGDVVPRLLVGLGRVLVRVPADKDGRIPAAADAGAALGLELALLILDAAEVTDAIGDVESAGEVARIAVFPGDFAIAPVTLAANLDVGVGYIEVVAGVDGVDLVDDGFNSAVEGHGLAIRAKVTGESGWVDLVTLGDELGFEAGPVVGVGRGGSCGDLLS